MKYRQKYQKSHRRFLKFSISLVVVVALGFFCYFKFVLAEVSPNINKLDDLTQPAAELAWPIYGSGAIGAVGYDGVLASYGDKTAKPIASITKIITALVVLEKKPIDTNSEGPNIKLSQTDLDIYNEQIAAGAASRPVTVGSLMSEKQMIETMILPSAANYSISLAIWAYGSVDNYLAAASDWLKSHDMNETMVVDTSGLLPENVSSPSDLIKLGKLALENKLLAEIVNMKQAEIPNLGKISNSNSLIGTMGINGIKTGTTGAAGACILFSSVYRIDDKNVTVIGVLLGADNRGQQNNDVIWLLKTVYPAFRSVKVISKTQEFGYYKTNFGQRVRLMSDRDIYAIVWSDAPIIRSVQADKIDTVEYGAAKGKVVVTIGNQTIKQPLIID